MTKILAIETSCDETAAAVIEDGRYIRSNIVASQIDIHRRYGGIFPEVASRQHILAIDTVIQDAITEAKIHWSELDAVAVTYGPGLSGSLLVGVNAAKGIALSQDLPLIGVNHLEGHLYSNWLAVDGQSGDIVFPALALIVSGGHTELVLVKGHGDYEVLGRTIDDAAGEAFDKTARLLGAGYPGGPAIQKAAENGNPAAFRLPRAKTKGAYDFSFSGLKTSVLNHCNREKQKKNPLMQNDICASFQETVVDVLVEKTVMAAKQNHISTIVLGGGVSSNPRLREHMRKRCAEEQKALFIPRPVHCTDNGGMIALAGFHAHRENPDFSYDSDVYSRSALA